MAVIIKHWCDVKWNIYLEFTQNVMLKKKTILKEKYKKKSYFIL